jgi:hypothetical protein
MDWPHLFEGSLLDSDLMRVWHCAGPFRGAVSIFWELYSGGKD